uniref:ATP-dependent helicase DinG n=1 Tax=uncultured Nocardioidaceae bacterium TaxID=253824 RepID=A0A6J4KZA6_9ACTN|nr:MAG: DinG family ATP-dependent helicase YoaA [uncultured Nocardioidaceae bacterium]
MTAGPDIATPTVRDVLAAAVASIGGTERPGQVEMAEAVAGALSRGEHLLVQAGTGTGKSLGYLAPSLLHNRRVVVATATLNLQHQLVERDIPALLDAAEQVLGKRPKAAVLKGRSNYVCLHRVRDGAPDDQGTLIEVPVGALGAEVIALREWAEDELTADGAGDRDAAPAHADRAWAQVSVSARECLGAQRCPYASECFAETARDTAMGAKLVVTNHALLAIDAIDGVPMIPEYDAVIVDEAHELTARVTQAATDELSPVMVERVARRARSLLHEGEADELEEAADTLRDAIDVVPAGRVDAAPAQLADALALVRDAARTAWSAVPKDKEGDADPVRQQVRGLLDEVRKVAERMAAGSEHDVLWVAERDRNRGGNELRIAPLDVSLPLRTQLFGTKTVVLTSATLKIGGDFGSIATGLGLRPAERVEGDPVAADRVVEHAEVIEVDHDEAGWPTEREHREVDPAAPVPWRAIDVGSPFDYARQAILYVAEHLPPPGRDGLVDAQLQEIAELVQAAGGRTLGLFSSRRAAEAATAELRERVPDVPVWCQGEAQLPELARRFVEDARTCLFGTLSLWQGVDLPGATCQLVIIDRIPFPRPDDPLMSARQRAVERRGGNGFMSVAASHAALLLAQGSGRLIRRSTDRGVVAVLDPRLVTARYGSFLAASLPPMWRTTDPAVVRAALVRLDAAAAR